MKTWFTSDQHFGHRNVIPYCGRPFADVEEMNEALVERFNARVSAEDTTYHLGDFSLDDRLVKRFLPRLHGRHFLIAGNHDKCHACHRRHLREMRRYESYGFTSVAQEMRFGLFTLCHLPYGSEDEETKHEKRYPEFRPKDEGAWLLHGHVHEKWKVKGRMINVGVDVWNFAPVAIDALIAIMTSHQQGTAPKDDG